MIGILSIQGGVEEHEAMLDEHGLAHKRVRSLGDIEGLTGLIIPGGESTVMLKFMKEYGLDEWIKHQNFPIYGTCAGMIVLAELGLLDAKVERNAYGRQLDSFVTEIAITKPEAVKGLNALKAHFIRAPKIVSCDPSVEVLGLHEDVPVLVKQGKVWASSFHPELAGDSQLHNAIFSH